MLVILLFLSIDLAELNLPKTCHMDFPDPNDLLNFKLVICPDEVRCPDPSPNIVFPQTPSMTMRTSRAVFSFF